MQGPQTLRTVVPPTVRWISAVSAGCENITEFEETQIKKQRLSIMCKELKDLKQKIEWNEEWSRLSIVEKTALMNAVKNYPKFEISGSLAGGHSHGLLEDAHTLFMKMKSDEFRHQRDIKNNYHPLKDDLLKRIEALRLELRTPEQVRIDERTEASRLARLQMFQD